MTLDPGAPEGPEGDVKAKLLTFVAFELEVFALLLHCWAIHGT